MNLRKILQLVDAAPANAPVRVKLDGVEYGAIDIYPLKDRILIMIDTDTVDPVGMYNAANFAVDAEALELDRTMPLGIAHDKIRGLEGYMIKGAGVRWMDNGDSAVVFFAERK